MIKAQQKKFKNSVFHGTVWYSFHSYMNLLINKSIRHHYEVLETYEAGLKLSGWEVKSLRKKHGSIKESYIVVDTEIWLVNAYIPLYQPNNSEQKEGDPYQKRKLLLSQKQIEQLHTAQKEKGLTVVPIRVYSKNNLIKIEIAIARGKKLHDKRKTLKERTTKREVQRAMKR